MKPGTTERRATAWVALVLASVLAGCSSDTGSDSPDSGVGSGVDSGGAVVDSGEVVDAAPEVGCDAYQPRAGTSEVLIGPDGLESALLNVIDQAENQLWVMMYVVTVDSFVDAFIAAEQRGVDVRVLLDGDHPGNIDARSALIAAGVQVRNAPRTFEFAHSKVILVDGAEAVIMSSNLTYSSMRDDRNYGVIDRDPEDLADLADIFESDWTGEGYPDLSCTRLVVSPINARTRLLQHINRAENTLELELIYLVDDSIVNAVEQRHSAGVAVRILLNDVADNLPDAAEMVAAGLNVRLLDNPSIHAKLVVSDGVPFIGSHNMSFTSLNDNREVGVMLTETGPAAMVTSVFESDWNNGTAP